MYLQLITQDTSLLVGPPQLSQANSNYYLGLWCEMSTLQTAAWPGAPQTLSAWLSFPKAEAWQVLLICGKADIPVILYLVWVDGTCARSRGKAPWALPFMWHSRGSSQSCLGPQSDIRFLSKCYDPTTLSLSPCGNDRRCCLPLNTPPLIL